MIGLKGSFPRFTELLRRYFPGVYIEESAATPRAIRGISSDAAAFVGPTLMGQTSDLATPVLSFDAFKQRYGGTDPVLDATGNTAVNYVAYAAKVFFENGGRKLFVAPTPDRSIASIAGALQKLESVDQIGMIAAPGYSTLAEDNYAIISKLLVSHAEKTRFRIALIDPPPGADANDLVAMRNKIKSPQAVMYTPWVRTEDSDSSSFVTLPPSPFIAGIFARVERQRGVHKAPANEVIEGAIGLEREISDQEQTLFHPQGINALRFFPGKGYLVWGARTLSEDAEWKYVNVRRYFLYLEQSITKGTEWAVFEPNSEQLWAQLRQSISNFMFEQWRRGALQGTKAEDAFFVRCDSSTMTASDIQNGRTICVVGFAPLKPSEFIIIRVGHKR